MVKRGSTIATLLASVFRDECNKTGVLLELNGVIKGTSRGLNLVYITESSKFSVKIDVNK